MVQQLETLAALLEDLRSTPRTCIRRLTALGIPALASVSTGRHVHRHAPSQQHAHRVLFCFFLKKGSYNIHLIQIKAQCNLL